MKIRKHNKRGGDGGDGECGECGAPADAVYVAAGGRRRRRKFFFAVFDDSAALGTTRRRRYRMLMLSLLASSTAVATAAAGTLLLYASSSSLRYYYGVETAAAGGGGRGDRYYSSYYAGVHGDDDSVMEELPTWMQSYVEFHRKSLLSSKKNNNETKYLRWTCTTATTSSSSTSTSCGGTGDRVSGILQAFYMAMCTDRVFLVDWRGLTKDSDVATQAQIDHVDGDFDFDKDEDDGTGGLRGLLQPRLIHWNATSLTPYPLSSNDLRRGGHVVKYPTVRAVDKPNFDDSYHLNPYFLPASKRMVEIRTNLWYGDYHDKHVASTRCVRDYLARFGVTATTTTAAVDSATTTGNDDDDVDVDYYYRVAFDALFRFHPRVVAFADQLKRRLLLFVPTNNNNTWTTSLSQKAKNNGTFLIATGPPKRRRQHPPYVAVHVRTGRGTKLGDTAASWKSGNETVAWPEFCRCVRRLQRGIRDLCDTRRRQRQNGNDVSDKEQSRPPPPVYLAADTPVAKRYFVEADRREPNADFRNTIRTVVDMEVVHVDRTYSYQVGDMSQAQLNVWADIKMLADATCLVMSGTDDASRTSKFSRLGKWLSPRQRTRRCSVLYDDCGPAAVRKALLVLGDAATEEVCTY